MAISIKAGTLSTPTVTGNQSYSVGFQPKLVIPITTYQTAVGAAVNAVLALGASRSSSVRDYSGAYSLDAAASSDTRADTSASRFIRVQNTAGTNVLSADFVSMDANGFTVNWTTVDASARIVNWLAIGGDLTVWSGQINSKASTGTQAYTGIGFIPQVLLLLKPHGQGTTTTAGGGVTVAPSFGWAASTTSRASMAAIDVDGQAAADSARYQRTDKCYTVLSTTGAVLIEADLTSFDADGFTLNWTTASGTARTVIAIALGGVQAKSGSFNQRSGTGSQAVTGVGFLPKALLTMGWGLVTNEGVITAGMENYFGWGTAAGEEGSVWVGSDDAADPSACDSAISTSSLIQTRTPGTGALVAEADLTSLDAGGFTLQYTTADTTARQNLYLAIGAPSGGAPGPWIEAGVVAKGVQAKLIEGLTNGVSYDVRVKTRDTSGNTTAGNTPVAQTPVASVNRAAPLKAPLVSVSRPSRGIAARRGRG